MIAGIRCTSALLAAVCLLASCDGEKSEPAQDRLVEHAPQIVLKRTVHFTASDGQSVAVDEGTYTVTKAGDAIRLSPQTKPEGADVLVDAYVGSHVVDVESPGVLSFIHEDNDTHHIALVLPRGELLEALGSYSGVQTRGSVPSRLALRPRISLPAMIPFAQSKGQPISIMSNIATDPSMEPDTQALLYCVLQNLRERAMAQKQLQSLKGIAESLRISISGLQAAGNSAAALGMIEKLQQQLALIMEKIAAIESQLAQRC